MTWNQSPSPNPSNSVLNFDTGFNTKFNWGNAMLPELQMPSVNLLSGSNTPGIAGLNWASPGSPNSMAGMDMTTKFANMPTNINWGTTQSPGGFSNFLKNLGGQAVTANPTAFQRTMGYVDPKLGPIQGLLGKGLGFAGNLAALGLTWGQYENQKEGVQLARDSFERNWKAAVNDFNNETRYKNRAYEAQTGHAGTRKELA